MLANTLLAAATTVNMLDYLVPDQRTTDALQFHLEGAGFAKAAWSAPNAQGDPRFVDAKGRGGYPGGYFVVKTEKDARGQDVQVAYLEWETMDWNANQHARGFHDANGYPTLEWGRSNVVPGAWNPQPASPVTDVFCGAQPDAFSSTSDAGYVATFYQLSDLASVDAALGSMGPVNPVWVDMAHSLGRTPEIMVIAGSWGAVRELYFYLKGTGLVSWRWQEHIQSNPALGWETLKGGDMTRVVWERTPIRILDLCEKVRGAVAGPIIVDHIVPKRQHPRHEVTFSGSCTPGGPVVQAINGRVQVTLSWQMIVPPSSLYPSGDVWLQEDVLAPGEGESWTTPAPSIYIIATSTDEEGHTDLQTWTQQCK